LAGLRVRGDSLVRGDTLFVAGAAPVPGDILRPPLRVAGLVERGDLAEALLLRAARLPGEEASSGISSSSREGLLESDERVCDLVVFRVDIVAYVFTAPSST